MNKIYKYELMVVEFQNIEMPSGSTILAIELQYELIQMWAIVDPEQEVIERQIHCHGTGFSIPNPSLPHLGTVVTQGGALIWHFFDGGEIHDDPV